ncbi:sex determination protein fruitless [Lutzomyia longipalpis]|uniref:sex determination protein fruitless n=1 Tax=Lutzomyia longipalpis TaxID=7200 RepID=UPI0024846531|nr:sex determination protein fruitless [Lutzomyia longipalpis]XP_055679828.1 sex determination protein fruitless [Lutzomyia longipalpis]
MDEFALCWNNFQDNIATGFQNLFDRGDLVDVSLACDGKILRAHKIVLAICSPYFQEMFITNPCKHPIIILKDVTYTVMSELLQFMYQGEVNVKHTELSSFMKIAETLQIKGLTTTQRTSSSGEQRHNSVSPKCNASDQNAVSGSNNNVIETKINTSGYGKEVGGGVVAAGVGGQKRPMDFAAAGGDGFSIYPRKQMRQRMSEGGGAQCGADEGELHSADSMDHMTGDEVFLPPIPQISMGEPRFDLNNVKRENVDSATGGRNIGGPSSFNLEYNSSVYLNKNVEYPNELHMANDFSKSTIHMDIPAGSNVTMLSTTSLLHGNCIFNRNNTVATQQGMKTYWLCKSYRITMCRARCITHQGRVISATGVHNHQPHMKSSGDGGMMNALSPGTAMRVPQGVAGQGIPNPPPTNALPVTSQASQSLQMANLSPQQTLNAQQMHQQHQNHHHQSSGHHHGPHVNVMHNVLSHNNLMQLSNMNPIGNPNQHHGNMHQNANLHAPTQPASVHNPTGHHLPSPTSQRTSVVHQQQQQQQTAQEGQSLQHHSTPPQSQSIAVTPTSVAASPGVPPSQQQPTPPSDDGNCQQQQQQQQQHEIPVSSASASALMSPTGGATFKMEHSM